jgi:hypothetical protein
VVVLPAEPVMPTVLQGTTSMKICESFESGNAASDGFSHDGKRERDSAGETQHIGRIQQFERMSAGRPFDLEFGKRLRATRNSSSPRMSLNVTRAP